MWDRHFIQGVVFPLLGIAMTSGVFYALFRTVNRWIDRRHEHDLARLGGLKADELDALRDQARRVDELGERVADLEGRLDFAERVLARQREERAIGGGSAAP